MKKITTLVSAYNRATRYTVTKSLCSNFKTTDEGVYAFVLRGTDDGLYVGETDNMKKRTTNHMDDNTSNRSNSFIRQLVKYPANGFNNDYTKARDWIIDNCDFKWIVVKGNQERLKVEGLFVYLLDAKYLG